MIERAILLTDTDTIDTPALPAELSAGAAEGPDMSDDLRIAVRGYEREHIRQVLAATLGNREEASRRQGIDPSTLYRRMKELNV